jgi:chemotaxis protein methyltransferase CheR
MTEKDFQFLKWKVRRLIGIDLDAYKPEQMRRRINNFVQYKSNGDYASFCRTLERNEELLRDFADMLTINVTEFFRDSSVFENLGQEVLPALLREKSSLKIWSAGCSRGSEAYTVAMLLEGLGGSSSHSIVATDIDKAALATAKQAGPYAPAEVKNVPQPLLARYFKAEQDRYFMTIKPRVRFLEHNLLQDEFERGFDLILCATSSTTANGGHYT